MAISYVVLGIGYFCLSKIAYFHRIMLVNYIEFFPKAQTFSAVEKNRLWHEGTARGLVLAHDR